MRHATLFLLPFALLACAPDAASNRAGDHDADLLEAGIPTEQDDDWAHVDPGQPLPPPGVLDLQLRSDASPGNPLLVEVRNLLPGDSVTVILSTQGEGVGPCPGVLGGLCMDIVAPRIVASGTADGSGVAQVPVSIPAFAAPGLDIWLQAAVARGANSDSSNVASTVITPDCPSRPDVPIVDGGLAAGTFDPGGYAVSLLAANDFGLHDFSWDADGDGVEEAYSGFLEYELYERGNYVCSAFFDVSLATSVDPSGWNTSSGGAVYEAWEFQIIGSSIGDSFTDCRSLDPAVWGTTDIREVLAADVSIGFGQMLGNQADLQAAYGADWATVAPGIYGVYVSYDQVFADEVSYGFGYEMADCATYDNGGMMDSDVSVPAGLYDISPWLVFLL